MAKINHDDNDVHMFVGRPKTICIHSGGFFTYPALQTLSFSSSRISDFFDFKSQLGAPQLRNW